MIRFILHFVIQNFVRGETNVKKMVKEAMDIGLIIQEVTKDNHFTNEDKALVIQEIRDFSDAAIKFIDEIEIPG